MNRKSLIIILLLSSVFLFNGFIEDNPYFIITDKDVKFTNPKGFPKPVYNFKENKITPDGFLLGRRLFYDPILSRDSSTSCASCHQRFAAFAHIDHPLSHGINGLIGKRNVPAIQNMIWQNSFMWDGGVNHLDVQPLTPIQSPVEMDESLGNIIKKLERSDVYTDMFHKAFHEKEITSARMLKAIAQFVSLMISNNSRYDKFLMKEEKFTDSELNGLKIFRVKCENCHKEPLFTDNSFRNNGLKPDPSLNDLGRYAITGINSDSMKFKVPGLRNVEMTYPYMHDGRFNTLEEVVSHYSDSKSFSVNADASLSKIGEMSVKDKSDVVAFLKTLTDRTFLYDRRFADPFFR
jgi:cytochrome c peroxidase